MQKIATCLWFNNQAEEAALFYTSIFRKSKILATHLKPTGSVMTIHFELDGHEFVALNGGPIFKRTETVSMVIHCETQDELDDYWSKLLEGGQEVDCGWLKDKYGLSWQVVPTVLKEMLRDDDLEKSDRVMHAMLRMKKLDIAKLKEAYSHSEQKI